MRQMYVLLLLLGSLCLGGDVPIADFRDPVTGAADIDLPSVAYNSRLGHYLVVWHGVMRGTGFNIFRMAGKRQKAKNTVFANP